MRRCFPSASLLVAAKPCTFWIAFSVRLNGEPESPAGGV